MSNKRIQNRLTKLFQDIHEDRGTAAETAARQAIPRHGMGHAVANKSVAPALPPASASPLPPSIDTITSGGSSGSPATLALNFQGPDEDWGKLQIVDENPARTWTDNDQLLVRQVVDQLTLALQNADLFQQTRRQNSELAVLNELGREIATQLNIEQIAETVYRHTSRLMDTRNFFVALTDNLRDEIRFPVLYDEGERLEVRGRKVGKGLTDWVIRHKKPLLLNGDVSAQMAALGLELLTIGSSTPARSWLGVPLVIGNLILGALVVQSTETAFLYQERQRDLLIAIGSQAAIALQNAILFQQTQQQNAELAVLNELGRELTALLGPEDVARAVQKYTGQLMQAGYFALALYDGQSAMLSFPLTIEGGKECPSVRQRLGNSPTGYVLRSRTPLLIPSEFVSSIDKLGLDSAPLADGRLPESWLGVPIVLGQEVMGAIIVQSTDEPFAYAARQRDLLAAIASQAAIALQNARLYQDEQFRRKIADTLSEMARIAGSSLEVHEVVRLLLAQLPRLLDFHTASVQLIETGGHRRQVGGISRDENRQHEMEAPSGFFLRPVEEDALMSVIYKTREPVVIQDTYADSRWDVLPETSHIRSWLGSPLLVGEEVIGFLILDDTRLGAYGAEALEVIRSFSAQAAVAVQNARLFEETLADEENFRSLVENAPEAIVVLDADTWTFSEPNSNAEKLFGLPREELSSVTPFRMAPERQPDGRPSEDVLHQKVAGVLGGEVLTFEWEIRNAEGQVIPTEVRLAQLPGTGRLARATLTDISDRKAAQEALRRQNEYLAAAAEVGRLVTSTLDLATLFERAVELVRSRFAYYHAAIFTLDEAHGNAVVREATGDAGKEMLQRGHMLPVGSRSIIGHVTSVGQTLVVNNTAMDPIFRHNPLLPETRAEAGLPLRAGERIIGALDIQATDVGAFKPEDIAVLEILAAQIAVAIENASSYTLSQQAVEELRQLDQIKTQFLANMSHELRTPLNSIIGFSRVILKGIDGPINEQQQQDLTAIYSSGQHLLGLINDILDLAKIEAGKMELAFEEVNLADTLHGVMSTAVGLVKDKQIRLREQIEPVLPLIRADPMRLRQILINLLSNAAKFTEDGEILVQASRQTNSLGLEEVLVSVTDSGPGIAAADQDKLFRAFSQVDPTPTRKSGGTGLGLSICKHLVDLHQGEIGVHSTVGRGSTFYFTVPAFHQQNAPDTTQRGKVVLCIDDDTQVIKLYERYLSPEGYQVEALTNPERAREKAREIQPFAITLDIMMPGYDGWRVLNDLKTDPETRHIPVIICSIVEEEERGFSLGAAEYLLKPILEDDLLHALDRLNSDGSISEVLVIDDDPQDLRLIEKILRERAQYRPILAEGGQKGWEQLEARHPQAVILDLFMPDLDGFTILERLRTSAEFREIPVIVVSGAELKRDEQQRLEALGKSMLQKGMLDEKDLFSHLERALKRLKQ